MAKKGTAKRARLTPEQRQDIVANKGKISGADLAKKHNVALATIYYIWKEATKQTKKATVAKKATQKSPNPNRNRIDFCERWIALLQAEAKRLEDEPDFLEQAEAALAKIIG